MIGFEHTLEGRGIAWGNNLFDPSEVDEGPSLFEHHFWIVFSNFWQIRQK